jgi:hypothetical protein
MPIYAAYKDCTPSRVSYNMGSCTSWLRVGVHPEPSPGDPGHPLGSDVHAPHHANGRADGQSYCYWLQRRS